jgi:hypothetical protein
MRKLSLVGLVLALGCTSPPPANVPDETRSPVTPNDLSTSLAVDVGRDSVGLALHLTNSGTQPLVLEFNSTQRYDFQVQNASGETVWTWSADKMFGQMMGTETIGAGESREYRASWEAGNQTGTFVAVGRVVATNKPIEQRTQFEIRAR